MLDKFAYEPSMYHATCARLKEFIQHFAHSGIALTRIGGCSAAWRPVVSRPPLSSITFNVYMSCLVRQWQAIDVERAVGHKYIVTFSCVCVLLTNSPCDRLQSLPSFGMFSGDIRLIYVHHACRRSFACSHVNGGNSAIQVILVDDD